MSSLTLVYDSEANNLLDKVTKMWCIYAIDKNTKEGFLFHDYPQYNGQTGEVVDKFCDKKGNFKEERKRFFKIPKRAGSLEDGVHFLNEADSLICHNQVAFDQLLMWKFYKFFKLRHDFPNVRDTMLESQVQRYNRGNVKGAKGIHGLAAWGVRCGIMKPEIEDWSYIDKFKLDRCIQDVVINLKVADKLEEERNNVLDNLGIDFTAALEMEHEVRYWLAYQELTGAPVDRAHIEKCIKELDKTLSELREEIEPQLPPVLTYHSSGKLTWEDMFRKIKDSKSIDDNLLNNLHDESYEIKRPTKKELVEFRRSQNDYFDKPNIYQDVPNKIFAEPTTTWLKYEKSREYSAVYKEGAVKGISCDLKFDKAKEARDWVKKHYVETKGWKFPYKEINTPLLNHHTCNFFDYSPYDVDKIQGPFTKIKITESTMEQKDVIKKFLLSLGWEPKEFTYKKDKKKNIIFDTETWEPVTNSPKLTEDSYESLPEGLGNKIATFNTLTHRRSYLANPNDDTKGVLNNIRKDGRITCGVMTFGTISGRC